jgi:hypothetical protein
MPMLIKNREVYKRHSTIVAWGINVASKMRYLGIILDCKLEWYPHTRYLENRLLLTRNSLFRCSKAIWSMSFHNRLTVYKHAILPGIIYASEAWGTTISKRAISKLQQIQRSFLISKTKAYRTVSHESVSAIAGIMPLDQTMHLYKDIRVISRGQSTHAFIPQLKKIEIPTKTIGIYPKATKSVDLSGTGVSANVSIYSDGSKRQNHVGASKVAVKNSTEKHTETQRLNIISTVFQAKLCGKIMAVDCIQSQR